MIARGRVRAVLVSLFVASTFVVSIFFVNEFNVLSGYPFLNAVPPRAPDIVYLPMYSPPGTRPVSLTFTNDYYGSIGMEMRSVLASGDELRIWESTRFGANVKDAVGMYFEDMDLPGTLTVWRSGHTPDGRANLLHARIGQTQVVITGALSPAELLRVADSLRRSSSAALRL